MMMKSARLVFCFVFCLLLAPIPAPTLGQGASSTKGKGKAQSCDGAADIVPAKPSSFVRKRRPAPKPQSKSA
jgi:hypothetical protein